MKRRKNMAEEIRSTERQNDKNTTDDFKVTLSRKMSVMKESVTDTTNIKFNTGIKFTILKTNMEAVVQKSGGKWQILVTPTDVSADKGMTIKEIVEEIKALMGGQESAVEGLEEKLDDAVTSMAEDQSNSFDPSSITFYLRQVFIYYEKDDDGASIEFAFSLEIDTSQMSQMLNKIGIFNLDGITLSIWNTNRQKIKEKMNIVDIDEYLKNL